MRSGPNSGRSTNRDAALATVLWMPPGAHCFACRERWGRQVRPSPVGSLRQLRTHSVQGAVRVHETELSHSVVGVTSLTETTLDSTTGPFRSDGIGI